MVRQRLSYHHVSEHTIRDTFLPYRYNESDHSKYRKATGTSIRNGMAIELEMAASMT